MNNLGLDQYWTNLTNLAQPLAGFALPTPPVAQPDLSQFAFPIPTAQTNFFAPPTQQQLNPMLFQYPNAPGTTQLSPQDIAPPSDIALGTHQMTDPGAVGSMSGMNSMEAQYNPMKSPSLQTVQQLTNPDEDGIGTAPTDTPMTMEQLSNPYGMTR